MLAFQCLNSLEPFLFSILPGTLSASYGVLINYNRVLTDYIQRGVFKDMKGGKRNDYRRNEIKTSHSGFKMFIL